MLDEGTEFSEEEVEILRRHIKRLEEENADLRQKNQDLTNRIERSKAEAVTSIADVDVLQALKHEYDQNIEELKTRLQCATKSQREHLEEYAGAQQVERQKWMNKVACLQKQLKSSEENAMNTRNRCEQKEAEHENVQKKSKRDIEKLNAKIAEILAIAEIHFKTKLYSVRCLKARLSEKPVLSIETTCPVTNIRDRADAVERKLRKKLEKKNGEIEVMKMKIKAENSVLIKENSSLSARLKEIEQEVDSARSLEESFRLKEQEVVKLRARSRQQKEVISRQQHEIDAIGSGPPSAIMIAKLRAKNEKLREKLAVVVDQARNIRPVMEVRTLEPTIMWDDIDGCGLPRELAETLASIVENDSLSVQTKFKHSFRTIRKYYEIRQSSMSSSCKKNKKKNALLTNNLGAFIDAISLVLVHRSVSLAALVEDDCTQREMLDAAKCLKTELKDAIRENKRLQRSFPAEEITQLRGIASSQQHKIRGQKKAISELRRRVPDPEDDVHESTGSECCKRGRETYKTSATVGDISTVRDLVDRISALERENVCLTGEAETARLMFLKHAKGTRIDEISEYEDLITQLRQRVTSQKSTIEALARRVQ